ncbi:DnaJ domain-containing protein [Arcobacter arenosus]|jgi:hypothetical protein|nr:DnaJ domain-containing protein [Arcobacter arenosus]
MGRELAYIISSLIKWGIFFGILYLIFTNFGTFLIIVFVLIAVAYYAFYQFKKKFKEQVHNQGFRFTFNGQDFSSNSSSNGGFDFREFEERFRQGGFNQGNFNHGGFNSLSELSEAKDFFGFTSDPTRDEIKRRYKELAKKYHPDINNHGDGLMQKLNHYKDVLLKAFPN